jgi:ankyrin repeat protein
MAESVNIILNLVKNLQSDGSLYLALPKIIGSAGSKEEIKKLLLGQDSDGRSTFDILADKNFPQSAQYLADEASKQRILIDVLKAKNGLGYTPINYAIAGKSNLVVKAISSNLLNSQESLKAIMLDRSFSDKDNETPLCKIVEQDNADLFAYFAEHALDAMLTYSDDKFEDKMVIHHAVYTNKVNIIGSLGALTKGMLQTLRKALAPDEAGNNPLHWAVYGDTAKAAEKLIDLAAAEGLLQELLGYNNIAANTPLYEALSQGQIEVAKVFLEAIESSKPKLDYLVLNVQNALSLTSYSELQQSQDASLQGYAEAIKERISDCEAPAPADSADDKFVSAFEAHVNNTNSINDTGISAEVNICSEPQPQMYIKAQAPSHNFAADSISTIFMNEVSKYIMQEREHVLRKVQWDDARWATSREQLEFYTGVKSSLAEMVRGLDIKPDNRATILETIENDSPDFVLGNNQAFIDKLNAVEARYASLPAKKAVINLIKTVAQRKKDQYQEKFDNQGNEPEFIQASPIKWLIKPEVALHLMEFDQGVKAFLAFKPLINKYIYDIDNRVIYSLDTLGKAHTGVESLTSYIAPTIEIASRVATSLALYSVKGFAQASIPTVLAVLKTQLVQDYMVTTIIGSDAEHLYYFNAAAASLGAVGVAYVFGGLPLVLSSMALQSVDAVLNYNGYAEDHAYRQSVDIVSKTLNICSVNNVYAKLFIATQALGNLALANMGDNQNSEHHVCSQLITENTGNELHDEICVNASNEEL